jgi:hypothetical protein
MCYASCFNSKEAIIVKSEAAPITDSNNIEEVQVLKTTAATAMNTRFRITDPDELEARGKCLDNCDEQFPVFQTDEDFYEWFGCYVSCYQVADEFNESSIKVATSSRFGGTI